MAQKIIFLETSDIGAGYTAEAAIQLGYDPVFLIHHSNYQADTRAHLALYPCIECDTTRPDAIVSALHAVGETDIAGVMTFLDSRLVPAIETAQRLDVHGLDPALLGLKDKGVVANLIPDFSPPTIDFHCKRIPFERIDAILKTHRRAILKSTQTAGGVGNYEISTAEFADIEKLIASTKIPIGLDNGRWVLQAFCEGPLVSAEGYVRNGAVTLLGFSGRHKVGLTESQIDFPADSRMSPAEISRCQFALRKLVARSGFKDGYFHVEFILTPADPVVIDANMGRLGGGSVGEQLADSYHIDPIDLYAHVIETSIFPEHATPAPYDLKQLRRPTLGILYGLKNRGYFSSLELPRNLKSRHTQILDSGQIVPEMGVNNWSWIGILSGPAEPVLKDIAKIKLCRDGVWEDPCF